MNPRNYFKSPSLLCATSLAGLLGLAAVEKAEAALLVYEPFNYAAGSNLDGQSGGLGWSSAWRNASNATGGAIVSGSLAAPGGLVTSGNSAVLSGASGTYTIFRDIPTVTGAAGTSTWISYLGQRQGDTVTQPSDWPDNDYPRGVTVSLFQAGGEAIGAGNSSGAALNEWSLIPNGSGNDRTLVTQSGVPYNNLEWVVIKINHNGVGVDDDAFMWLSPNPGAEPLEGTANVTYLGSVKGDGSLDYSELTYLRQFIGDNSGGRPAGQLAIDEFRIGTTFADMSAVPEPSVALLGGLSLLGLLRRRRD